MNQRKCKKNILEQLIQISSGLCIEYWEKDKCHWNRTLNACWNFFEGDNG
jgi:hypothetical protein